MHKLFEIPSITLFLCAFLWLKNPRNLRNPWLINDLRACKALYNCRDTPTNVMDSLQISLFMQNEPNFRKSQMNVSIFTQKDYEKRTLGEHGKNEPKTNPIKANKMPKQTQNKPNLSCRSLWRSRIKPNSLP